MYSLRICIVVDHQTQFYFPRPLQYPSPSVEPSCLAPAFPSTSRRWPRSPCPLFGLASQV